MAETEKPDHRAGKDLRVTSRDDIQRLFRQGRRAVDGLLTLVAAPQSGPPGPARVGVAVAKRHGNAVRRNRLKRLCREASRLIRDELPGGWDYMIIPRAGTNPSLGELQQSLRKVAVRVAEQTDRKDKDS